MIKMKKRAEKFCSINLDKSTSSRSRKYINLNLHCDSDHVNLEMARIKGSMPAKRVENLEKERLQKFGLKMEDIVATTTDEASMMKSFGSMICCIHELCFAHGYHLPVTDFLYAKQNLLERLEEEMENHYAGSDSEFSS